VLDVWENEPSPDIELIKRVDLGSPHIAGYSYDGKLAGTSMIYLACCQHFSIEPDTKESLISDDSLSITLSEARQVIAAMREAVLSCYDVAQDDQRFRGGLLHCDEGERAAVFDELRKKYPVRRELSRYRIENLAELEQPVIAGLAALGFICR
jgi:erythronate-4-phosphate dehydrogenase